MSNKPRNISRLIVKGAAAAAGVEPQQPPQSRVVHSFGDKMIVAAISETTTDVVTLEACPTAWMSEPWI